MGVWDAVKKLQDTLDLSDFGFERDFTIGVPATALSGNHPAWYLDLTDEDFDSGFLQPVAQTSSTALLALYVVLHEDDVEGGQESLMEHIVDVVTDIRQQIESAVTQRLNEQDGGLGASWHVLRVSYQHEPSSPIAAARINLELRAYA